MKDKRIFLPPFGFKEGDIVRVSGEGIWTFEETPRCIGKVENELGKIRLILFNEGETYYVVYLLKREVNVLVTEKFMELAGEDEVNGLL